jgi:hypothetical protein
MSAPNEPTKKPRKGPSCFATGCLTIVGPITLVFGLLYWLGGVYCIDSPCTDKATTGPAFFLLGAIFTALLVFLYRRNRNR